MAKSVTTDKRENEKKKLARRAEKQKKNSVLVTMYGSGTDSSRTT